MKVEVPDRDGHGQDQYIASIAGAMSQNERSPKIFLFAHGRTPELLLAVGISILVLLLLQQLSSIRCDCLAQERSATTASPNQRSPANSSSCFHPAYSQQPSGPLVVFLHGSGSRGSYPAMVRNLEPFVRDLPAIVITPNASPHGIETRRRRRVGRIRAATLQDRPATHLLDRAKDGWLCNMGNGRFASGRLRGHCADFRGPRTASHRRAHSSSRMAFHCENDRKVPLSDCKRLTDANQQAEWRLPFIRDPGRRP
jgi:hypothetical protein